MEDEEKSGTVGLMLGALVVGAIAGMLFAPKKGSELRDDLSDLFRRNRKKALDLAHDLGDKIPSRLSAAAKDAAIDALRVANEKASAVLKG
jgi:gas vesicle protein